MTEPPGLLHDILRIIHGLEPWMSALSDAVAAEKVALDALSARIDALVANGTGALQAQLDAANADAAEAVAALQALVAQTAGLAPTP